MMGAVSGEEEGSTGLLQLYFSSFSSSRVIWQNLRCNDVIGCIESVDVVVVCCVRDLVPVYISISYVSSLLTC